MELVNIEKSLKQLTVVKRNGRKVEFEGDKIAIAIKKAFDSVENEKYTEKDANKVYIAVLKEIYDKYILERQTEDNQKRIKIEENISKEKREGITPKSKIEKLRK